MRNSWRKRRILEKNRRTVMNGGGEVESLRSKGRGAQDDMVAVMARDGFVAHCVGLGWRTALEGCPTKATASPFMKR